MLAAQALASLNIARAHWSRRHSTKSEYTDEFAQETSGPIKRSYENARMCSHGEPLLLVRTVLYFKRIILSYHMPVFCWLFYLQ